MALPGERKQIEGLDQGWIWIYSGEEEWINSKGDKTTARHAKNYLSGDTLSVKQVRNQQRLGQGLPVTPIPTGKVREGVVYTKTKESHYRGNTVSYSFRTLEDAQMFVQSDNIPEQFRFVAIQTKFKNSKIPGKDYKRYDKNGNLIRSRYASLSTYLRPSRWKSEDAWNMVYEKAQEFNYDKNSRFYVYATEQ